ncbi:uncharacterized protein C2845_PM02G45740 [Panicum miliaceum]|uniref:Uncharacterized protein n=1 Tax=Panicum miliaceum TaxID=4540 RepID=A0A3L6SCH1_PANMI|nr:uncharacterized protein C2845_PM02G45740 [Panicum miliaceum]
MPQGTSPLPKDKGPTTEPGKAVGIKRLQTDTPSSPGYHNVYVRRKVESEHSKVNPSQELKGNGRDKAKEQEAHQDVQHEEAHRPQVASHVAESVEIVSAKSPEKTNPETVPEKTEPPVASGSAIQEDVKPLNIQYWNERFNRLQTYLESCDHSTQEGYLQKLRSLSAAGRSMHAIELVEEGKELQRMKALNVLGKVSPNAPSKATPFAAAVSEMRYPCNIKIAAMLNYTAEKDMFYFV